MMSKGLTQYGILFGYAVFLMAYFSISLGIGVQYLVGNMPVPVKPYCTFGLIGIDGAFDCVWSYLQPLFILFSLNSSIGIFNLIILVPFLLLLTYMVLQLIRGTG